MPLIIFGFIFYLMYRSISKNASVSQFMFSHSESHNQFIELLCRLAAHIIMADKVVNPVELQIVKNFFMLQFNFSEEALRWVNDILNAELKEKHNMQELGAEINQNFNYDIKLIMLDMLYQIAVSDFEFHHEEQAVIDEYIKIAGIQSTDAELIRKRYVKIKETTSEDRYFRTLGLEPGASKEEIKKAYKTLAKRFHPDVVNTLGESFRKANEQKMKDLTEAYHALR